jgi:hypothetical protein
MAQALDCRLSAIALSLGAAMQARAPCWVPTVELEGVALLDCRYVSLIVNWHKPLGTMEMNCSVRCGPDFYRSDLSRLPLLGGGPLQFMAVAPAAFDPSLQF